MSKTQETAYDYLTDKLEQIHKIVSEILGYYDGILIEELEQIKELSKV